MVLLLHHLLSLQVLFVRVDATTKALLSLLPINLLGCTPLLIGRLWNSISLLFLSIDYPILLLISWWHQISAKTWFSWRLFRCMRINLAMSLSIDECCGAFLARIDHGMYRWGNSQILVAAMRILDTTGILNIVCLLKGALPHCMVIRIICHTLIVKFNLLAGLLFEKELILIRLMSVCILDFFEGSRNWLRGSLSSI